MRTRRTHYEVLGLPRDAALAQIKRRYKELVRTYHPDVARDKVTAHRLFIQINEAYETLSDPLRRRAYDETLENAERRAAQASASRTAPPRTPRRGVDEILKDAQRAFIHKRLAEAANLCKEALRIDWQCARAHSILGDVYRAGGRTNSAIKSYSYALQFDPADRDTEKKLMNLVGKRISTETKQTVRVPNPSASAARNMLGWTATFFFLMLISVYPGEPIPWLKQYIPPMSMWSWNLAAFIAAASACAGAMLSINGLVRHPDEELVFESGSSWTVVPSGLILLIGSGFFFVGAAAFYVAVGLIQSSLSKSMLTVFACVVGVVLLAALMYEPDARSQVVLFGGNVSFLSMLAGWYAGASTKPLSEY